MNREKIALIRELQQINRHLRFGTRVERLSEDSLIELSHEPFPLKEPCRTLRSGSLPVIPGSLI